MDAAFTFHFVAFLLNALAFKHACGLFDFAPGQPSEQSAECIVSPTSGDPSQPIQGTITFYQHMLRTGSSVTEIKINLRGFHGSYGHREHGFHIHSSGGLGDQCKDAGGHYNPLGMNHGAPSAYDRHIGDLGSIYEDMYGGVITTKFDTKVKLDGPNNVLHRAIVIHAVSDDLGLGGNTGSVTTGNAGARIACCTIVPKHMTSDVTFAHTTSGLFIAVTLILTFVRIL